VHLVGANVSTTQALVAGTPIELAFDRLLLPSSVTRQTFVVQDLLGNYLEPAPAYDPVSRIVRLCVVLAPDQTYRVGIVSPQNAQDTSGLRAIDGAELSADTVPLIEFPVMAGPAYAGADSCPQTSATPGPSTGDAATDAPVEAATEAGPDAATDAGADATIVDASVAAAPPPPPVDFCSQILPLFVGHCGGSSCHSTAAPAAGLRLTSSAGVEGTAIGRVAQGSNTGTRAAATAPNAAGLFGVDMAIIAPGDPGQSWLLYKLLMADPPTCSTTPNAPVCDASVPTVQDDLYDLPWAPLSDGERATLSNLIPGREMPFPTDPNAPLAGASAPLTLDETDRMSLWILQGATVQTCTQ